jgi:hypothetical protein
VGMVRSSDAGNLLNPHLQDVDVDGVGLHLY